MVIALPTRYSSTNNVDGDDDGYDEEDEKEDGRGAGRKRAHHRGERGGVTTIMLMIYDT